MRNGAGWRRGARLISAHCSSPISDASDRRTYLCNRTHRYGAGRDGISCNGFDLVLANGVGRGHWWRVGDLGFFRFKAACDAAWPQFRACQQSDAPTGTRRRCCHPHDQADRQSGATILCIYACHPICSRATKGLYQTIVDWACCIADRRCSVDFDDRLCRVGTLEASGSNIVAAVAGIFAVDPHIGFASTRLAKLALCSSGLGRNSLITNEVNRMPNPKM